MDWKMLLLAVIAGVIAALVAAGLLEMAKTVGFAIGGKATLPIEIASGVATVISYIYLKKKTDKRG